MQQAEPTAAELRRQFQDLYTRYHRVNEGGEQAMELLAQRAHEMDEIEAQFADWSRTTGIRVKSAWRLRFQLEPSNLVLGLILIGADLVAAASGIDQAPLGPIQNFMQYYPGFLLGGLVITTWAVAPTFHRFDKPDTFLSDPNIAEKVDEILARRQRDEQANRSTDKSSDAAGSG